MNRRDFLTGFVCTSAVLMKSSNAANAAAVNTTKARLKISSQEPIIPGRDLQEKLANMEKWGFDGLEVGGSGLAGRVKEIQNALKNSRIVISAICAGFSGVIVSDQESERRKCVDSMKEILTAAGELKSTGLVYAPAFNGQTKLDNREARKIIVDILPELSDHAANAGTRLLMEPLNRGEAFFLRQLADAASICRDVNHPACCMMGDFYHMHIEETSDLGAFLSGGEYVRHVHLASIKRNLPGQDARDFTSGFAGLKMIGYNDFCSLECGVQGNAEEEIPKSVRFLKEQWKKAHINPVS